MSKKSKKEKIPSPSIFLVKDPIFYLILTFGFLFRLFCINKPFRNDEAYTFLHFVSKPFSVVVTDYHFPNNHIFHSILMRVSYLIFGGSDLALRLPVLVMGLITIYLAYIFVREVFEDKIMARWAAGIFALSNWMVLYSVNARGYIFQGALVIVLGLLFLMFRNGKLKQSSLVYIMLCGFLVLYTIPTGLIFILPFLLALFIRPLSKMTFVQAFLVSFGMTLITYLFYIPILPQLLKLGSSPCTNTVERWGEALQNMGQGIAPMPVLLGLVALGLFSIRKKKEIFFFSLLVMFGYPCLELVSKLVRSLPCIFPRNYFLMSSFIYIFTAVGLVYLLSIAKKWVKVGLILLVVSYWSVDLVHTAADRSRLFNNDREVSADCRSLVHKISKTMQNGDRVMSFGAFSCEPTVLMELVRMRNFRGYYGLQGMDRVPSRHIYFIAKSKNEIDDFVTKNVPSQYWTQPNLVFREEFAVSYSISRLK